MNGRGVAQFLSRAQLACLLLILAACQVTPAPGSPYESGPAESASSKKVEAADLDPDRGEETEVILPVPQKESLSLPTPVLEMRPAPTGDPLRFTFPTPGPEPISAWRPPLYPTPWEPTPNDHFYFGRPIAADQINWPLADYRYGGVFFSNVVHTGVDIPAPKGTDIMAAGPGKVIWAGFGLYALLEDPSDPYGLAVAIKHNFGYEGETLYTVYGHMDSIEVVTGQYVDGGELLGYVGETGKVTGPHLHFEVRIGKNNFFGSRNPELWMAPPQGWGVLAARVMDSQGYLLREQNINIHSLDLNRYWEVNTYGEGSTNSDPYYHENMVIGDLPAGNYDIWIEFDGTIYNQHMEIKPGMVSYFTFMGSKGFKAGSPPTPGAEFIPPDSTETPEALPRSQ